MKIYSVQHPHRCLLFWVMLAILVGEIVFTLNLKAQTPGNRTVSLSWPAVPTATGYNVYKVQGPCAGGTFNKITATPITAPTFMETGLADGVTRCYRVTAVNAAGESTPSGTIEITTPTYTAPLAAAIPAPPSLAGAAQ